MRSDHTYVYHVLSTTVRSLIPPNPTHPLTQLIDTRPFLILPSPKNNERLRLFHPLPTCFDLNSPNLKIHTISSKNTLYNLPLSTPPYVFCLISLILLTVSPPPL